MSLLEVEDLRTWFETHRGTARAVDGVSFRIEEGEAVGIVGESGCGKTVTSLSLMGLVPPPGRIVPGSSIRLRDRELVGASDHELRRVRGNEIAMIFQEPMTALNPLLPVGDQIREPLARQRRMSAKAARARAVELLREVGIPEPERRFGEYPHQLSGGMRQRAMIAMALSCEPAVLVADEPTTALDVTIQAQILELLAGLRRDHGMALLLITHDLGVVAEVCDRVLVMYAGRIVEAGGVEEIFAEPRHPYTRGLLASLPRLDARGERLVPIPGTVPSALDWPAGCRFRDRCPSAWDQCREEPPAFTTDAPDRTGFSRCWLERESPPDGAREGPDG